MKKIALLILILSVIQSDLHSQIFDTIVDGNLIFPDTINQIDSTGLKQGYWYLYTKEQGLYSHTDFAEDYSCVNMNYYTLKAEGRYINSKKVGVWKYYRILNRKVIGLEKSVNYLKNGNYIEQSSYWKYKLEINSDTTFIIGEYYLDNDTILINCIRNKCVFKLKKNKLIIDTFNKSEFDLKFYGLLIGDYNRKIKILKE